MHQIATYKFRYVRITVDKNQNIFTHHNNPEFFKGRVAADSSKDVVRRVYDDLNVQPGDSNVVEAVGMTQIRSIDVIFTSWPSTKHASIHPYIDTSAYIYTSVQRDKDR